GRLVAGFPKQTSRCAGVSSCLSRVRFGCYCSDESHESHWRADFPLASLRRFSTVHSATQSMASRVRVGFFFGTGLFACVWIFSSALIIQSADSVPPLTPDKTNAESGPLEPPNFQEQQDAMQQAIEQTRREA